MLGMTPSIQCWRLCILKVETRYILHVLSQIITNSAVQSYAGGCAVDAPGTYLCTGPATGGDTTQTLNAAALTVTIAAGFGMTTAAGDGLT